MRNLLTILITVLIFLSCNNTRRPSEIENSTEKIALVTPTKIQQALKYCQDNNLSTDQCVLIDMSIHSGKNRLYVYDFNKNKIILESLCSHGCGDYDWASDDTKTTPKFSNIQESHLSSLGKYKIGNRGWSNWGVNFNYKLHGLESSNSNAYKRTIVLHSWEMVDENEIFPYGTPEGWGCPAISNEKMRSLDKILQSTDTPQLMWIYQ